MWTWQKERERIESEHVASLKRMAFWKGFACALYTAHLVAPVAIGMIVSVHYSGTNEALSAVALSCFLIGGAVALSTVPQHFEFRAEWRRRDEIDVLRASASD